MIKTNTYFMLSIYDISSQQLRDNSKSFYFASMFLTHRLKRKICLLYYFCRVTDDIFDESCLLFKDKIKLWKLLLDWTNGKDVYDIMTKHSQLKELKDLILSMKGIDELHCEDKLPMKYIQLLLFGYNHDMFFIRPRTSTDLLKYCIQVAGSVGCCIVSLLPILVTETILSSATDLGIAFQLTNIARDIKTDRLIGRKYVPLYCDKGNDLDNAHQLVLRAEPYYESANKGLDLLPIWIRFPLRISLYVYREIGMQLLKRREYPTRETVSLFRKLLLIVPFFRKRFIVNSYKKEYNTIGLLNEIIKL